MGNTSLVNVAAVEAAAADPKGAANAKTNNAASLRAGIMNEFRRIECISSLQFRIQE